MSTKHLQKFVQARANKYKAEMIGNKFGKLTVISYNSQRKCGYYNCVCECGNTTIAQRRGLLIGKHRSCGCYERKLQPNHYAAKNYLFNTYKNNATKRSLSFRLSKKRFFSFLTQNCHYCNTPPAITSHLKRHKDFKYNGVDRVNNSLGYSLKNCVTCCLICNLAKRTLSVEEWLVWIKRIYKFQRKKKNIK